MNKGNVYVDIHALQTVPPSCVNRDDTGSPKTAIYGGVTRARVSSQAWKHAIRTYFQEEMSAELLGSRTKMIIPMVAKEIEALAPDAACEKLAIKALENAGLKFKDPQKGADALFFMSHAQACKLAELAVNESSDKNEYKKALKENPSIDMIFFGRMVASDPSLNYDAAVQVAHSISTHAVHAEYDYFTAVDDESPEDNAGAGHLGTVEFNSATLYRYATVNVREVQRFVGEDTGEMVRHFLSAFIHSMPTGKQNSFANRTLPDAIYIAIRTDQPINLAGAFEKPVMGKDGFAKLSEKALYDYAKSIYKKYGCEPALCFGVGNCVPEGTVEAAVPDMLQSVEKWIQENI